MSTSEQVASGLGLDAQQTAIEAAAARLGLSLVQTFTDAGVSGGLALEYRPALLAVATGRVRQRAVATGRVRQRAIG